MIDLEERLRSELARSTAEIRGTGDPVARLLSRRRRQRRGRAGVLALVTVAASDADNLFITMSARLLNEGLFIVARAEDLGARFAVDFDVHPRFEQHDAALEVRHIVGREAEERAVRRATYAQDGMYDKVYTEVMTIERHRDWHDRMT